ncbi:hypothetical protein QQ045_004053 [Rhodiola kirilowii]
MAPKRSKSSSSSSDKKAVVGSVVKRTTRQVVKETVEVAVIPSQNLNQNNPSDNNSTVQEVVKEIVQELLPVDAATPASNTKSIPVSDNPPPQPEMEAKPEKHNKSEKSKKTEMKGKKRKVRRRGGVDDVGYKRYMFKVLKQVHPGVGISGKAMTVLNGFMNDMFERLAVEARKLTDYTARKTMSAREIQGAVRLVLPGELGKHAVAEGTKAVTNYMSYSG